MAVKLDSIAAALNLNSSSSRTPEFSCCSWRILTWIGELNSASQHHNTMWTAENWVQPLQISKNSMWTAAINPTWTACNRSSKSYNSNHKNSSEQQQIRQQSKLDSSYSRSDNSPNWLFWAAVTAEQMMPLNPSGAGLQSPKATIGAVAVAVKHHICNISNSNNQV